MVNYTDAQLDRLFFALSDQTRRAMISQLSHRQLKAQELAEPFAMSLPAISKHLKVLEKAQLVRRRVEGRNHLFSLNPAALEQAGEWVSFHQAFWQQSLTRMEQYLNSEED